MATRLYEHPIFLEHITPEGHPERPDRLRSLNIALEHPNFERLVRKQAPQANEDAVLLAHPEEHLLSVMRQIPEEDGEINRVEADTYVSPKSLQAALTGIGAAMVAVDDVFTGAADNVFVASRPPGHHAETAKAMGFCLFNNAAIAARHAQKVHGAERVAIIDWDVHHGNGTQDIFWNDTSVLFCSTHQMPLYPWSGDKNETGVKNNVVNAPSRWGGACACPVRRACPRCCRSNCKASLSNCAFPALPWPCRTRTHPAGRFSASTAPTMPPTCGTAGIPWARCSSVSPAIPHNT